ncbi:MAG TPA: phytoene/squalene synthase family protein [Planctomycetia bacterium]|nr:phytoene/squalene synthase family protein [Planctomycetia bacterium]
MAHSTPAGAGATEPAPGAPASAAPGAPASAALAAAYGDCERIARRSARNFYYTFLVLPADQRRAMCALYAFLRATDDLGDEDAPREKKRAALADWEKRLDRALVGDVAGLDRWWAAFADTVRRHDLPAASLRDVVRGVASDLEGVRYDGFADLYSYCYHVASAVGLLCIRIWGCRDPNGDVPAEWCGVAFQMTNILRDVAEDYRIGRVYLPTADFARFGAKPEMLGAAKASPELLALLKFEIDRTRDYYRRAERLLDLLPPAGRAVLRAMLDVYGGLLKRIESDPARVLARRVRLHPARKLAIAAKAFPLRFLRRRKPGWTETFDESF